MITIRPIRAGEEEAVKRIILRVAYKIFGFDGTLEDSRRHFTDSGAFRDMDDVKAHYEDAGGMFFVVHDGQRLVGSGAMRGLDAETGELKRMWLLEPCQGQGIGYRLIQKLFEFARAQGYQRVRLQTSPEQTRALEFYRQVGFYEIPCYNHDLDEISMEIDLSSD
ncbi:MAG: hypothetical protein Kow002_21620 [Anaerolineales bacterium]